MPLQLGAAELGGQLGVAVVERRAGGGALLVDQPAGNAIKPTLVLSAGLLTVGPADVNPHAPAVGGLAREHHLRQLPAVLPAGAVEVLVDAALHHPEVGVHAGAPLSE